MHFVYQMNNTVITHLIGLAIHLQENVIHAFTFAVKSNGLFSSIFSSKNNMSHLEKGKLV